jgi:PAS domain S-box-containing protein
MSFSDNNEPLPVLGEVPVPAPPAAGARFDLTTLMGVLPSLMDSLTDAIAVVDRQLRVVAANRRYADEFGWQRDRIAGQSCQDALHCPEHRRVGPQRCPGCRALEGEGTQRLIRSLPDAEGRQRRWEATFSPVTGVDGTVTHVVEAWRDISDRSRLEAQLAHSERLASLGVLAAGVGHEINNPLASLMAAVETLDRMFTRGELLETTSGDARELVRLLEREVTRCRETTDKLMLLAQPYSTAASWVDLNAAVRDSFSLLRYSMRKQNVVEAEHLAAGLPRLWARESGLRGVCMNLMMNAVQAMPRGGELRVGTAPRGEFVVLTVEDTGPGIPEQLLGRIWEPFFTTKATGQGTGLGLSVTHAVVSRHGGTIHAENRPEGGARFVVALPVHGSGGDGTEREI